MWYGFEYGNENILILTFVETYGCIEKSALLWSENAAKASYLIKNPWLLNGHRYGHSNECETMLKQCPMVC